MVGLIVLLIVYLDYLFSIILLLVIYYNIFLFSANKKVHSEAYGCSYRGCSWNSGTQGIDWDYYSTTNGNCTYCMRECDKEEKCEGVECGGEHCS